MVWLVRANRDTNYRGGDAKTMREEFAVYGFPDWLLFPVGILKVLLALFLLSGIWYAPIVRPAATAMAFLMLVAVVSHFRVRSDSPRKAFELLLKHYPKHKEKSKNKMVEFFNVLGNTNELTIEYRKRLSQIMFS